MSVRRALVYSFLEKYAIFGLSFIAQIVLARLLTPSQTGVFSIAMATIAICHIIRDFGVSEYLIQKPTLSEEDLRASFTLTLGFAWTLTAIVALLAYPIGLWYENPELTRILWVLCVSLSLFPFGSIASATLARDLQFRLLMWSGLVPCCIGIAIQIWLALKGFGAMSLAIGSLATNLLQVLCLAYLRPRLFAFRPSTKGLTEALKFGGSLASGRLVEKFGQYIPDFAIGARLGFHANGVWSKTVGLVGMFQELFNASIIRVAAPMFARLKPKTDEFNYTYNKAANLGLVPQFIFYGFLGLHANDIVRVLFGAQWAECVPLIQTGSIMGFAIAPSTLAGTALVATGFVHRLARAQIMGASLVLVATLIGVFHSLEWAVVGLVLGSALRQWLYHHELKIQLGIRIRDRVPALVWALAIATLAVIASLLPWIWRVPQFVDDVRVSIVRLGASAFLCGLVGLIAIRYLPNALWPEIKRLLDSRRKPA